MVVKRLHDMGMKSEHAYMAAVGSVALSVLIWAGSLRAGSGSISRADRWGIFVGEWAPTFFALGNGLRTYEVKEARPEPSPEMAGADRTEPAMR